MGNIAVLDDKRNIFGFSIIGFEVFQSLSSKKALKILETLQSSGFSIVYMTESLLNKVAEKNKTFRNNFAFPIISISSTCNNKSLITSEIEKLVQTAVGMNIVTKENRR
ncbi:MAG: hypothetical protein LBF33_03055 [Oscillospiraceae bacterium]|nr:hypothetical protein [Oscillospiraceae bacterium]